MLTRLFSFDGVHICLVSVMAIVLQRKMMAALVLSVRMGTPARIIDEVRPRCLVTSLTSTNTISQINTALWSPRRFHPQNALVRPPA